MIEELNGTLQAGITFADRYVILERMGQGGMATIFKAMDLLNNCMVAVKHLNLPAHLSEDEKETRIERFEAEAEILGLLDHPHIMSLQEYIVQYDQYVMILELIEGLELKTYIQTQRSTLRQQLQLFDQLADALEYIHAHGIVHCDLKPENVLVLPDGQLKLLDFGIARIEGMEIPASREALVGTLHYMSPEQLKNSRITHFQIDIYALGVIMYELLTGRLPFEADNPGSAMLMILNQEPPAPLSLRPELGNDLNMLISTCLQKRTEHRFRNCRQFRQLLKVVLERGFPEQSPQGPPIRSFLPAIEHFADFGLIHHLEQLIAGKASGNAMIWNDFQEANLWLENGELRYLDIKNKSIEALSGFYSLMCWESGNLLFIQRSVPATPPLSIPQGAALLQQARQYLQRYLELWEFYQGPDIPEIILQPTPTQISKLSEPTQMLLESMDGKLCIAQLQALLNYDLLTLLEALKSLEDRQIIFVDRIR